MKSIKLSKYFASGLVTFTLGLCSACMAADQADFDALWNEANEKRKAVAAINYEWRDTGEFLETAKKEQAAGNHTVALALIAKALEQGSDALAQAEREKDLWQARVPK